MSNSPLTIIAMTTAKTGKEAALGAAQEELVAETLMEDGCLRYELHQSLDDGRIRIFVEGAAMQRFLASGVGDYFADFSLHRLAKIAG
jgi:quinol monooxygenase YgiN